MRIKFKVPDEDAKKAEVNIDRGFWHRDFNRITAVDDKEANFKIVFDPSFTSVRARPLFDVDHVLVPGQWSHREKIKKPADPIEHPTAANHGNYVILTWKHEKRPDYFVIRRKGRLKYKTLEPKFYPKIIRENDDDITPGTVPEAGVILDKPNT